MDTQPPQKLSSAEMRMNPKRRAAVKKTDAGLDKAMEGRFEMLSPRAQILFKVQFVAAGGRPPPAHQVCMVNPLSRAVSMACRSMRTTPTPTKVRA